MPAKESTVAPLVQQFAEQHGFHSTLEIGGLYMHPHDGLIRIVGGSFWGTHGLSNFWDWAIVETGEKRCGYGGDWPEVNQGGPNA